MEIKVLGSGCVKCNEMERVARAAVDSLGLDATVEHVSDFAQIMSYGVMATPALVIDGEVRLSGRVPAPADMERVLSEAASASGAPADSAPRATGGCGCGGNCC